MLLGALIEKPMSAYEMKKNMEARNINSWVKISSPSVYKNLVAMNGKGYLDDEVVKEGERPAKKIYSINEKGRNYFFSMMEKYSKQPDKIYIDFVAFVANLYNVDPEKGLEMMKNLRTNLSKEREYIKSNIEAKKEFVPFYAISILELYDKMYAMFSEWTEEITHDYVQKNNH
ncbi:hypothetical protein FD20_GL002209 [Liquorilactobacillus uvarum DSM 19971]|uniref:Transcription regulator PadR N-terminal domain-containing protein n=2 Tax=Liquorilactobacillus uvarum TaxID=303240 RepID=A0A0R1PK90_9LACO|nr:hypothetical protein FD20_GL002209 [Liquorilactobacillus uvarum DSM 19971]